jgi:uncharacterized protein (TIGR03435 family)
MTYLSPLANHLWQSTIFAVAAMLVTLALRKNRAQLRYWLWLAASIKFLIPFSLLVSLGGSLEWRTAPSVASTVSLAAEQISESFTPLAVNPTTQSAPIAWPAALVGIWLCGFACVTTLWWTRWRRIRSALRSAKPMPLLAPIRVMSAPTLLEPGVFGIFRPVLLLPAGIADRLTSEQLQAILAHELCHVRRRDNLAAWVHMVVEALFWFHPLVWWIGARLIEERERACDEEVLTLGNSPFAYAEGILNVCKHYVQSPLACTSGVTGADLKKRIREIMTVRVSSRLTWGRKVVLTAAGVTAITLPVVVGLLRAQTLPPPPAFTYEVVSIRAANAGDANSRIGPGAQGGVRTQNTTVMQLLTFAYDMRDYQFEEAPGWVRSERFDVNFTPDKPEIQPGPGMARDRIEALFDRQRQRMRAVLRDRFGLRLRADTKERPMYALTIARRGHKLGQPKDGSGGPHLSLNRSQMTGTGVYLDMVTRSLSNLVQRPVINETGLNGPYDFELRWTPDSAIQLPGKLAPPDEPANAGDSGGTSIFTALTEQLGLRLESRRGPVTVFVIEHIEKPAEN